jgi:uncharacterized membrane protein YdbT with pleckstrin-like domain
MSYVSRRLALGETVQYEGKFHWIQKAWPWVALLVLGVLVVGVIIWLVELVRMGTTQMVVTNRRVLLKKGFFSIKLDELTLGSIEGSHVDQSIFGRIFGYGKLTLRGRGETQLLFPTMDRPGAFRAAIEDARMHGEVQSMAVAHEPEPPADETRHERKLRLKLEAERERRAHHH